MEVYLCLVMDLTVKVLNLVGSVVTVCISLDDILRCSHNIIPPCVFFVPSFVQYLFSLSLPAVTLTSTHLPNSINPPSPTPFQYEPALTLLYPSLSFMLLFPSALAFVSCRPHTCTHPFFDTHTCTHHTSHSLLCLLQPPHVYPCTYPPQLYPQLSLLSFPLV